MGIGPRSLRSLAIFLVILAATTIPRHVNAEANSLDPVEDGLSEIHSVCQEKDITEYLNCIDSYNEKLRKRETITIGDLEACTTTRKSCLSTCKVAQPPCDLERCPICPTMKLVEGHKKIIVEGESKSYKYEMPILPGQNITTIIRLTNIINNTNIVDIPTNINSTNVNNIHIYNNETSDSGGLYGLGYDKGGSCCYAVQPRTCSATSSGLRCHHKRHKTCGPQCTSRIMHIQSRQRCSRSTGCQNRVGYVPQPRRPRCVYTSQWPHVSCGGQYQQTCDGCYDHYGYGASSYYSGGRYPRHCNGCYDDGFEMGPLYRRGPVFQPFAYHQPPCYLTGTCMPTCNYYGCYGNEYMDPAFGYPGPPSQFPNEFDSIDNNFVYTNEIEGTGIGASNGTDDGQVSESWGVQTYKCKVVGDDGVTHLRNCTSDELSNNPFAGSPSEYPYYPPQANESPDYDFGNEINVHSADLKRESGHRYRFPNPRQDFVYDDYMSEESYVRPPRRAHRKRNAAHKKRKVQVVYDE